MRSPVQSANVFTALLFVAALQMLFVALKWTDLFRMSWIDALLPSWVTLALFSCFYVAGKIRRDQ